MHYNRQPLRRRKEGEIYYRHLHKNGQRIIFTEYGQCGDILMSYTFSYEEPGYIKLLYEGDADLGDLREVITQGVSLAVKQNCFRVLSDFRLMRLHLSAMDIFSIPAKQILQAQEMNVQYFKYKRTMVVPAADFESYKFFENVAVNRSHNIKVFTDFDEALAWLLG